MNIVHPIDIDNGYVNTDISFIIIESTTHILSIVYIFSPRRGLPTPDSDPAACSGHSPDLDAPPPQV